MCFFSTVCGIDGIMRKVHQEKANLLYSCHGSCCHGLGMVLPNSVLLQKPKTPLPLPAPPSSLLPSPTSGVERKTKAQKMRIKG